MKHIYSTFVASCTLLLGAAACGAPASLPMTPAASPAPAQSATTPTQALATVTPAIPTATLPPTVTPAPTIAPVPTATPLASIDAPDWFRNAIVYQIFPRSFADSDGDGIGDLNGIARQLDYIQSLGVTAIWLTPHYPSPSYHGYDVADYVAVNPQFGTLDDFKNLIAELDKREMRLIVDFVANHASTQHPYFQDAYGKPDSAYTKWFQFTNPDNTAYSSFAGVRQMPEWNHNRPEVVDYLIESALFWLDLGVAGLRCDFAKGVPFVFWQKLRHEVKAKYPDAVLLGEVWDGNERVLADYFRNGFDALFDFPWHGMFNGNPERSGDGVLNAERDAGFLRDPYRALQRLYPPGAQLARFASNHDTNRIASEVDGNLSQMKLAAAAVLLTPGVPFIYYGEEIGMRGRKGNGAPYWDEYRREPMDWHASESGPLMTTWFRPADRYNRPGDGISVEEQDADPASLLNTYRALAALRASHPALRSADFELLTRVEGCPACLAMWRWSADEVVFVALNFSNQPAGPVIDQASAPVTLTGTGAAIWGDIAETAPWGALVVRWPR